jgi:uncharacterized protein
MYYRNLETYLSNWKKASHPKPLIIRGARQVGKTSLVNKFSTSFTHFISLNLERSSHQKYFDHTDDVKLITEALLLTYNIKRQSGDSLLLFIDEIQNSPKVIALLRYFYEDLKNIHVIAAGSLLDFALGENITMPVGRVEQVVLHPLTFDEFLLATSQTNLYAKWQAIEFLPQYHEIFTTAWKQYLITGGMPGVIKRYVEDDFSFANLPIELDNIWLSYIEDIAKYSSTTNNTRTLNYLLTQVRFSLQRFSFASLSQSLYKSKDISASFLLLEKARILSLVYPTTDTNLPLTPNYKKRPRIQFLDTGLLMYINKQTTDVLLSKDLQAQFSGGIINHLVWQEIIAQSSSVLNKHYFWVKELGDSNAEVDLLLPYKNSVLPVEIKLGASGRLRSLFEFIDITKVPTAVRILDNNISVEKLATIKGNKFMLVNIPVYAVGKLTQILEKHT